MNSKKILLGNKSREQIISGINKLANVVKSTLGPNGKYVVIDKEFDSPVITNDGVSIVKEIELKDTIENIGAKLLKEASEKTDDNVGDGTTTTALITQQLVNEGERNIALGRNALLIKRGMEYARDQILKFLEKNKKTIKDDSEITSIATISSKDEQIGQHITDVIKKIGKNGIATIEKGSKFETEIEITEGIHFDEGFAAPFMVTDKKSQTAEYDGAKVLVYDGKIENVKSVVNILEETVKNDESLVIMANEFSEDFLATILINSMSGQLKVLAVKNPGFGEDKIEELKDIALYLGTEVYTKKEELKELTISDLGEAKSLKATKNKTIIIGGDNKKEEIKTRIEQIEEQLKNDEENSSLKKRLAKLTGGIGVIKVGGSTESEIKSKKIRYEDALNSAIAAIKNGIVEGGGMALLKSVQSINKDELTQDVEIGVDIVTKAMENPIKQIVENAGLNGEVILHKIYEQKLQKGFDVVTKKYVDMFSEGIIDPTSVISNVVKNSISIASLVLITNAVVASEEKEKENNPGLQ